MLKQYFPAAPEAPSSPLEEALAHKEVRLLIRNGGGYRRIVEIFDQALDAQPFPENDPAYVPFMETLALALHEGENTIQADAILDKLKTHLKAHGLQASAAVGALELSLKNSPIYRNQGIIDPEFSGVEP